MKQITALIILFIFFSQLVVAQSQKKLLDNSVYDSWNTIKHISISNNGKWVSYEVNPYLGDGKLVINNPKKSLRKEFSRAKDAKFSPNSNFIAFKIAPEYLKVREQKLKKVKADKLPKDTLRILNLADMQYSDYENINKFLMPKEKSDWMAFTYKINKTEKSDTSSNKKEEKKKKQDSKDKTYNLVIKNPIENLEYTYDKVTDFNISENGKLIGFIEEENDSIKHSKVKIFNTQTKKLLTVFNSDGELKKITLDRAGNQCSFIFSADTTKVKTYSLYHWKTNMKESAEIVIDTNSIKMPKDWVVSEHCKIWFSKDDSKMYFGTALRPEPEEKDTLLDEEKVRLDLWSWTDDVLQPQQLVELKKDKNKNYLTVYQVDTKKVIRLSDEFVPKVVTLLHGNSDVALGISDHDFRQEQSWDYPYKRDYYRININNGDTQIIREKTNDELHISAFGNYVAWFDRDKKHWYAKHLKTKEITELTTSLNVNFQYEMHDMPSDVPSYGYAGWSKNDEFFFVYDRYDIWKIDPSGKLAPQNITEGKGRQNKIKFRYLKLDQEKSYIDIEKAQLLSAFNETNKKSGYYSIKFDKIGKLKQLIYEDYRFFRPIKAKNADYLVWQKSSISEFPNIRYSKLDMKKAKQISDVNPQQKDYNWAQVELVKWTTFDGKQEEGLLYKPENFDPQKKYPVVLYFYELKSDNLHAHYYPKPSRSIINPVFYASNGYLVFMPNIRYEIGHPGKSAYNYVVSGTKALMQRPYVDKDNIGIEGQSWGGYQVAYLVTQTNMYKAAISGAPVSNMTSAYGEIRWKSGLSRMFQYEKSQSRIGATLWEKPDLYLKNSPLFYADKVETPLLIFHNDNDGAVPWYQGIELFVALRRLKKPVWLVNYNGEPHNLKEKSPACKDWSMRMMQFFNHYLKGKAAPEWMTKGIPAIRKGKDF